MTKTIQDRIIKDFKENLEIYVKKCGGFDYNVNPAKELEQFLIQSIKEVQEETRKQIIGYVEKRKKEVNIFSKETGDIFVQDILKFITNKEI